MFQPIASFDRETLCWDLHNSIFLCIEPNSTLNFLDFHRQSLESDTNFNKRKKNPGEHLPGKISFITIGLSTGSTPVN